jgi:hypothetical protein
MKKCWDSNPSNRPTFNEICSIIEKWYPLGGFVITPEFAEIFEQAEEKRLELIQLKKLGPEFSEKSHPKAIYTSRALSSLISKPVNLSSMIPSNMEQGMLYHKI